MYGKITCQANLELYVSGKLDIKGLTANANLFIEVDETGLLVVNGNISYRNNTSIIVNGGLQAEAILVSTNGNNQTGCIGGSGKTYSADGSAPFVPESITIPCAGLKNPFPKIDLGKFELDDNLSDRVYLSWNTLSESEDNGMHFTVQRSTDMVRWLPVGTVNASGFAASYEYDDLYPVDGFAQYRLRLTDENGKFSFSEDNLDAWWTPEELKFKVVKNHSFWTINLPRPDSYLIEAYTIHGRRIVAGQVEQSLTIPAPEGAVVVRVTNSSNRHASRVVL